MVNKQLTTYSSVRDHLNATFHCNTPKLAKGNFKEASLKKIDHVKKGYFGKKQMTTYFLRKGVSGSSLHFIVILPDRGRRLSKVF